LSNPSLEYLVTGAILLDYSGSAAGVTFCFTKLSILIFSSLKIYCDGDSDICNVIFVNLWTYSSRKQSHGTVEN